jgi:hypothetical protein
MGGGHDLARTRVKRGDDGPATASELGGLLSTSEVWFTLAKA